MKPADYHRVLEQAHSVRLLALNIDREHLNEAIVKTRANSASDRDDRRMLVAIRHLIALDGPGS